MTQKFFNRKQTQKVSHCSKKKRKGEKGKRKKSKIEKPKDVGHLLKILTSAHAQAKRS